ncbi:MAG: TonB-dependent receptor [Prevotella ruminicola]|uniref:TonB-dependent receptor n=1 Tax=Xylanibacter ruminicola TaxID=839 RepID=A0A928GGX2_XYLRU|nr:TonB-dependent receptor [Xylanibacter ruminicola]
MISLFLLSLATLQGDTIASPSRQIDEVVVVSNRQGGKRSIKGQVASIDEHLSQLSHVSLVRRGSYAWEPMVNNMQTERLSTTIDGMKIFYACTDKMDPVTSYVESGNLQSISLNAGLNGNPQATGNIGGALDLRLRKAGFDADPIALSVQAGYEANGHLQVYGADAAYSSHRFYINGGLFYRHADNYKTGGGYELPFSQFHKFNAFANLGVRLAEHDAVEGVVIVDHAGDVGYPALAMDVKRADAFITSLAHRHTWSQGVFDSWETKVYFNHILHDMDDTKRPDVVIHMDMPGRSTTAGFYSLLAGSYKSHSFKFNADGYFNRLFADMTMYPGGAAPMYMVTWPDVHTYNTGLAATDDIMLPHNQTLRLSAKLAWQQQYLCNHEGYEALKVFFPGIDDHYQQLTGRIAASYSLSFSSSKLSIGAGWGSRAPTVTEAYGYYLNNTFDKYDYIGNPRLSNESAIEANAAFKWQPSGQFSLDVDAGVFFFSNYIIGSFEPRLSAMTLGAAGVKVYHNIPHATIVNASLTAKWNITGSIQAESTLGWATGRDDAGDALPLISPLSYSARLAYHKKSLLVQAEMRGNARQSDYAAKYGETLTAAWTVFNLSAQYSLGNITIRTGIENLFDRLYATYADWNDIPQKGRNIYINLSFDL